MTTYSFITTDIETLNNPDNTNGLIPIIQIAAVAVPAVPVRELKYIKSLNTLMDYVDKLPSFNMPVRPLSTEGDIDISTVAFHIKNNGGQLLKVSDKLGGNLCHVIQCYYDFVGDHEPIFMYARPPQFDLSIIKNHALQYGLTAPWNYWQERCERTLLQNHATPERPPHRYPQHDALSDAQWQTVVHLYSMQGVNESQNHNTDDSDMMRAED